MNMKMKMDLKVTKKYMSPLLNNPNIKKMLEVSPDILSILDKYEELWIYKVYLKDNKAINGSEMKFRTILSNEIQIFIKRSSTWSYNEESKKRLTFH